MACSLAVAAVAAVGVSAPWLAASMKSAPTANGNDPVIDDWTDLELERIFTHSPLPPIPPSPTNRVADDPDAAHFGQYLFFDTRLSGNGDVSCSTCHVASLGWGDGKQLSEGVGETPRHAKSLWNVAWNRWYNWDGSKDSLWSQAIGPLEAPLEMGNDRLAIAHLIADETELREAYEAIFGSLPDLSDPERFPLHAMPRSVAKNKPLNDAWKAMTDDDQRVVNTIIANIAKCIAAYQRRIVSRDAPFDRFVEGLRENDPAKRAALSPAAQRGLRLFVSETVHCRSCHVGPNFTDSEFHSLSIIERDGRPPRDPGRFEGAKKLEKNAFNAAGQYSDAPDGDRAQALTQMIHSPETWGQFKTPSLRSVSTSAPYMHQGQFRTLESVLAFYNHLREHVPMGHHQESILVPLRIGPPLQRDLIAFLRSLDGAPLDPSLLEQPATPRRIVER